MRDDTATGIAVWVAIGVIGWGAWSAWHYIDKRHADTQQLATAAADAADTSARTSDQANAMAEKLDELSVKIDALQAQDAELKQKVDQLLYK